MKKHLLFGLVFLTLAGFSSPMASAGLPINVLGPGLDLRPPEAGRTETWKTNLVRQAQPYILRSWVMVRATTLDSFKGNNDMWSWLPQVRLYSEDKLPSGAHYYVEFMQPNGSPWVKLDCKNDGGDHYCKSSDESDKKSANAAGLFPFAIKMRNELAGTDVTLFTGKAKVEKAPSSRGGNKFVYYVNHDWALPIGYVLHQGDLLAVSFWTRQGNTNDLYVHVFYKGKEISSEGGHACGQTELEIEPSMSIAESHPHNGRWERVLCSVAGLEMNRDATGPTAIRRNPGEYEIKVLWNKKLARSIKFTIGPDGEFVDNGIAKANGFVNERTIVPVTIIGDQDGQWDRNAWKTDAYYGNPIKSFSPPQ